MALEVGPLLTAAGVIVVGGFLAHLGFRRWRLPEALVLIALGLVMGPLVAHWGFVVVDVEIFRTISPLIGTVAIIVILFDGGLEIRLSELKSGVASGSVLAVLVFAATALLCAGIAHVAADMPWGNAMLMGMAFGGAGAVIVIPLIRGLRVRPESVTVVSIEAAVSDVLVIVGVYGLAQAMTLDQPPVAEFARELFFVFSVGIVAGAVAGFLWARVLGSPVVQGFAYVLTLGALLLLYVGVEHLEASGPIAVLAFGLVVGNSKRAAQARTEQGAPPGAARSSRPTGADGSLRPVFGKDMAGFHQEVVFLIRAFFFVSLGVVLDVRAFREPAFLLTGFLFAVAVVLGRYWGVVLVLWRSRTPRWDRTAITLMFPLGLAAAALSQVPQQQFGIPGTESFVSYAAVTIVLTNLFCSLGVYVVSKPSVRKRYGRGPEPSIPQAKPRAPSGLPPPR